MIDHLSCGKAGTTLVLSRIRVERNERRFYAISVITDLFGNHLVLRNWGRIGTGGRIRFDRHHGPDEAVAALERLARQKTKRGYVSVGSGISLVIRNDR